MHEVRNFTDEFLSEIYPQYLKTQKIYLALAIVLPLLLIPSLTALTVMLVLKRKKKKDAPRV